MIDNEIRATGAMPNLEWFLNLFISKYRKRIEMLIAKDEVELDFITENMSKIQQILSPAEYAKHIVAKKEIENEIELLKSLL